MSIINRDLTQSDIKNTFYAWVPFAHSRIIDPTLGRTIEEGVRLPIKIYMDLATSKLVPEYSTIIGTKEKFHQIISLLKSTGNELNDDDLYLYGIATQLTSNMTSQQIKKHKYLIVDKQYNINEFVKL